MSNGINAMEIKIGKSARACLACERLFVHQQELNSLVRIENQRFLREDYCADCWNSKRAQNAFSAWSFRFVDPKVAQQAPPEAFLPLRKIFYEVAEANDRPHMATAYLAAQLLRRQKVFRLIKEADDPEEDVRVSLLVDRVNNKLIEVRDPHLAHEELEVGQQTLVQRLKEMDASQETEEDLDDAPSHEA